jgi:hypothetical protein
MSFFSSISVVAIAKVFFAEHLRQEIEDFPASTSVVVT